MNASDALLAIQKLMDGVEWSADTLEDIAVILREAGYQVRDLPDHGRARTGMRKKRVARHG